MTVKAFGGFTDSEGIDPEVIAVIAAAVAAFGMAENKRYNLTSVKPINTMYSPWRLAGLYEAMSLI